MRSLKLISLSLFFASSLHAESFLPFDFLDRGQRVSAQLARIYEVFQKEAQSSLTPSEVESTIKKSYQYFGFDQENDCKIDPYSTKPIVFAFEGFMGYHPQGAFTIKALGHKGLVTLSSNPQLMADANKKMWRGIAFAALLSGPIFQSLVVNDSADWLYFSHTYKLFGLEAAQACYKRLRAQGFGERLDRDLVLMGFSYGGHLSIQMARWIRAQGHTFREGISIDPVPKGPDIVQGSKVLWLPTPTPKWLNYYQKTDTETILGFIPLRGNAVPGAENHKLTIANPHKAANGHLFISAEQEVIAGVDHIFAQ